MKLRTWNLKSELADVLGEQHPPTRILMSTSRSLAFYIYQTWIDVVSMDKSGGGAQQPHRQKNSLQILSTFVWEDLLFYSDIYSIWLCYPALHGRQPLKIKLASVFPGPNEAVGRP